MSRAHEIDEFVHSLAHANASDERSLNIYENEVRRNNLRNWLATIDASSRTALFVGEAPGIKGARITGIPFTSPYVLMSSADPWDAFGQRAPYEMGSGENGLRKEATATVFWQCVSQNFGDLPRPLTWNAYPFWPHRENRRSNRPITMSEIRCGSAWLRRIIEMHPNMLIVAVGRKAEHSLGLIGVGHIAVRHPSHGGKLQFAGDVKLVAEMLRREA